VEFFSGGQVVGRHTIRSIAQIFVGIVFNVSPHLHDFCCGNFFMSALACRPATPRLWSELLVLLL
jgi:hypothetical protein